MPKNLTRLDLRRKIRAVGGEITRAASLIALCHAVRRRLIAYHGYQRCAKRPGTGGRRRALRVNGPRLRETTLSPTEGERDTLFLEAGLSSRAKLSALSACRFYERAAEQRPYVHVSQSRNTIFRFLL